MFCGRQVRDADGIEQMVGVSCLGLLVYHDRLRIRRYTWAKIIKISYKEKKFSIHVRPNNAHFASTALGTPRHAAYTYTHLHTRTPIA